MFGPSRSLWSFQARAIVWQHLLLLSLLWSRSVLPNDSLYACGALCSTLSSRCSLPNPIRRPSVDSWRDRSSQLLPSSLCHNEPTLKCPPSSPARSTLLTYSIGQVAPSLGLCTNYCRLRRLNWSGETEWSVYEIHIIVNRLGRRGNEIR